MERKQLFFLILALFICSSITYAATPNPGHPWTEVGDGTFQVTGPTLLRTYTFPDANATVVTGNSFAQGDLIYGSAAGTVSQLAKDTNATRYLSNTGTSNNPAWSQVNVANGVSGILTSVNGGTGNGFAKFSGPTTSEKTFTLPDASASILTSNTPVTVAQGGTGLSTLTANSLLMGNAASSPTFIAPSTDGNILQSNGTTWSSTSGGVLNGRQVLTSGTTYTPTSGTKKAVIQMWGGGGGGGGCSAVAGCAGGGGGAGGYAEYYLTGVTGTYAYVIGASGVGNSGGAGGGGGNTTFNTGVTTITAFGGSGGTFAAGTAAVKFTPGGAGAVVSTNGNVNEAGNPGEPGLTSTVTTVVMSGNGGATSLGGAGIGKAITSAGASATANSGSGGSGAAAIAATAGAGGAGGTGLIVITEYR